MQRPPRNPGGRFVAMGRESRRMPASDAATPARAPHPQTIRCPRRSCCRPTPEKPPPWRSLRASRSGAEELTGWMVASCSQLSTTPAIRRSLPHSCSEASHAIEKSPGVFHKQLRVLEQRCSILDESPNPLRLQCHRSRTSSPRGWEQQIRTLPSAGASMGSGE